MQTHARLVIIGAGITGCSAAYHLAGLGWTDVVVLDQGAFPGTGGSTTHTSGTMFQTSPSRMLTGWAHYSVHLYESLTSRGQAGAALVGSIELAETPDRLADLKRRAGLGKASGLETRLLTPDECRDRVPILSEGKVLGGYHVPDDGVARPLIVAEAMTKAAADAGCVTVYDRVAVRAIVVEDGRVRAVITSQGRIECDMVLCCAGIWGPLIGRMAGQPIPLMPMEHQYVRTGPVPELAGVGHDEAMLPLVRAPDHALYFRQHWAGWGIGSYRHAPMAVEPEAIMPPEKAAVMPSVREWTPEHFEAAQAAAIGLFPCLAGKSMADRINGLVAFTPDGMPLLGESAAVKGFWVAEGVWLAHAGGAGRAIAQWLAAGEPQEDVHEADVNRFQPHARSRTFIRQRCLQAYAGIDDISHPRRQTAGPRDLRLSPVHARLTGQEAVFFEAAGHERPQWFEANGRLVEHLPVPEREDWAALNWSPIEAAEALATREAAALYDLSNLGVFEIAGPGALAVLDRLCTARMDIPPGDIVQTLMLSTRGGIMADPTISRLAPDRFQVVTGNAAGPQHLAWIRRHLPADGSAVLTDLTGGRCILGLWGPHAREVLRALTDADLGDGAFPDLTWQDIAVGDVPVRAQRVARVGEPGWELHVRADYGIRLWDTLWPAGRRHGMVAAGAGAFDALRLEKGRRLWGWDIGPGCNPLEAGLEAGIAWDKPDFIGKAALEAAEIDGITRRLCAMTLDDPEAVVLGDEPVLADGRVVGHVTSASRGHAIGRFIAYGWLSADLAAPGTKVAIEYFGEPWPATVAAEPLFDPDMSRIRG